MTDKADTVLIQQLREIRELRADMAALREDLRGVERKVDGLAAMMASIAGLAAAKGDRT